MPQSFDRRFAGREQKVMDEIKVFGWMDFCKHEGIAGFALNKWFQKQPGHKNDSIHRYSGPASPISDLPLIKQIALAIQKERSKYQADVAKYQDRIEETNRRIEFLEEQLRYYKQGEYLDLKPLYELCFQPIGEPIKTIGTTVTP